MRGFDPRLGLFKSLCLYINLRGYSLIGKTAILHIVILGSSPNISNVNINYNIIIIYIQCCPIILTNIGWKRLYLCLIYLEKVIYTQCYISGGFLVFLLYRIYPIYSSFTLFIAFYIIYTYFVLFIAFYIIYTYFVLFIALYIIYSSFTIQDSIN